MIKLVKECDSYVSSMYREYVIDSSDDLSLLPSISECAAGSIAISADGVSYILTPSNGWCVHYVGGGSSSSGSSCSGDSCCMTEDAQLEYLIDSGIATPIMFSGGMLGVNGKVVSL